MFYRGLKKGTILYRKNDEGSIDISEIKYDLNVKDFPFLRRYVLQPILGNWVICEFKWCDSSKVIYNETWSDKKLGLTALYPIGTDINKVGERSVIYNY